MSGALNKSIMRMSHAMPSASVSPKPLTEALAKKNSDSADTRVTRSASTEVTMACRTPVREAARTLRPMRISSRKRSMVRMEESAAMPMVSTMPAMPASERLNSPKCESVAKMPRYSTANTTMAPAVTRPSPR